MSLFLFRELMKLLMIALLLLSHPLTWADNHDANELGRALANYQACSEIATDINDEQMFVYYRRMFNDTGLSILSFHDEPAKQVYSAWGKSEKVLLKIGDKNLQKICLSRFDDLSRSMVNKTATP